MMRGHRQRPVAQRDGSNCQQWFAADWKLPFPQRRFAHSIFLVEFKQSLLVGLSPFCVSNIFVRFRFFGELHG